MIRRDPSLEQPLHYKLPYLRAEVVWAVRREWAQTLSDVLRHRTRALILDAAVSMIIARDVAEIMARELGHDPEWVETRSANTGRWPGTIWRTEKPASTDERSRHRPRNPVSRRDT
jgi:Glycerol-3-phosphate dehydrogenase